MSFKHLKNYDFELSIQVGNNDVILTDAAQFCELVNLDKSDYVTLKVNIIGEFAEDVAPQDLEFVGDPQDKPNARQDSEPAEVREEYQPINVIPPDNELA